MTLAQWPADKGASRLSLRNEEYIPCPLTYVRPSTVEDFRAVTEAIAVLVNTTRLSIIKADRVHTELLESVHFAWLRNAIVI